MQKNGMNISCLVCGKIFYQRSSRIKQGSKYCSPLCYHKSREIHTLEDSKAFKINCLICKKLFKAKPSQKAKYCSKKCYAIILKDRKTPGDKHFNWKGGKTFTSDGYVMVWCPGHPKAKQNYISEHRLVMEKHLGRYLTKQEVVHHINEVITDNRIENLMVLTPSEHARLHKLGKKKH